MAIRLGKCLMIENCGENLDPVLDCVLVSGNIYLEGG
jgi:hypothetical protein